MIKNIKKINFYIRGVESRNGSGNKSPLIKNELIDLREKQLALRAKIKRAEKKSKLLKKM